MALIIFRQREGILPCKWEDLQTYISKSGRYLVRVSGDGFCLLHAIKTSLMHDYDELAFTDDLKTRILNYLLDNTHNYDDFHNLSPEQLIEETTKFFESRDFDTDFGDMFVQMAADALSLNMYIYQQSDGGQAQLIISHCQWAQKTIHLKFSRTLGDGSAIYNGANHYDSFVKYGVSELESEKAAIEVFAISDDEECEVQDILETFKVYGRSLNTSPIDLEVQTDMLKIKPKKNLEEHSSVEIFQAQIQRFLRPRTKFPEHLFDDIVPIQVDDCPDDIDGNLCYKIPCNYRNWLKKSGDRRYFALVTSSKENFDGKRKVGFCEGSHQCNNPSCPYLLTNLRPNRVMWDNVLGQKVCYSCSVIMNRSACEARKLVKFSAVEGMVYVYHIGHHKCQLKKDSSSAIKYCADLVKKYPNMTITELKKQVMKDKIFQEEDFEGAKRAAELISDRSLKIARRQHGLGITSPVDKQSLEAVGLMKEKTDRIDPFLIHKIHKSNDEQWNDEPDFVFCASGVLSEILFLMNQDGDKNPLQGECLFFDGAHSRCTDYIALALWVYHSVMRKLLRIATMYTRKESAKSVEIFFNQVNDVLQKVSGNPEYILNPRIILCDNSGANLAGMTRVFGQDFVDTRVLGCRFHFLNCVEKAKNKIGEAHRLEFVKGCHALAEVPTVAQYKVQLAILWEICDMYPDSRHFLNWWDARRYHVFKAFRDLDVPGMNLAEIGNSSWKPKHGLSLVEAAKDDAASMTAQVGDYLRFRQGEAHNKGKGPSYLAKANKSVKEQMAKARAYGEMFENAAAVAEQLYEETHPNFFHSNKSCKHKPAEKKGLEGKRSRKDNTVPTLKSLLERLQKGKSSTVTITEVDEPETVDSDGQSSQAEQTTAEAEINSLQMAEEMMNAPAETQCVPDETLRDAAPAKRRGRPPKQKAKQTTTSPACITENADMPASSSGECNRSTLDRALEMLRNAPQAESNRKECNYAVRLGAGRSKRFVRPIPSTPEGPNPPIVTKLTLAKVCQGCRDKFDLSQMVPPNDLVVQVQAVRPYPNADQSWWTDKISNAYLCLKSECLKKHNANMKLEEMKMNRAEFNTLSDDHLHLLHNKGFLTHIMENLEGNN